MNEASQWRLAIATKIAPYYAAYANVEAVVVLGGVARGWADDWSDIDLVVLLARSPDGSGTADGDRRTRGAELAL